METLRFDESGGRQDRVRIFVFSDLHWPLDSSIAGGVIAAMGESRPDLIIFSGDLFSEAGHLGELEEWLSRVPDLPRFAVIGNHEYRSRVPIEELEGLYRDCGFTFLINQSARVNVRGRELCILGMDDLSEGAPDTGLMEIADPDLVIVHEPGAFPALAGAFAADRRRLFFSGHTHGGQITLFGLPLLMPPGSGRFVAGRYTRDKDVLFVSRGLGTSVLPVRIFARPDVMVVDF